MASGIVTGSPYGGKALLDNNNNRKKEWKCKLLNIEHIYSHNMINFYGKFGKQTGPPSTEFKYN